MPAQTVAAPDFWGELGAEITKAHNAFKNETPKTGGNLNPQVDIKSGVARLVKVGFQKYKEDVANAALKGKWFFMAQFRIVTPKLAKDELGNVVNIEGDMFSIGPEPMCPTPTRTRKTVQEHFKWVMMQLKVMGAPIENIAPQQYGAVCAGLTNAKGPDNKPKALFIKFHNWLPPKATEGEHAGEDSQYRYFIDGVTSAPPAPVPGAGTVDESGSVGAGSMPTQANGHMVDDTGPVNADGADDVTVNGVHVPDDGTDAGAAVDIDLDALAQVAQGALGKKVPSPDERAAVQQLEAAAVAAGVDLETFQGANTYAAGVEMIRAALGGDAGAGAEEPAADDGAVALEEEGGDAVALEEEPAPEEAKPWVPAKGEQAKLTYKDPKTGATRKTDVEIMEVDKRSKTVKAKNLANTRQVWPKVPWASLVAHK